MIPAAALLACFLHLTGPKAELVEKVWLAGGVDSVALVSMENPKWDPECVVPERGGYTSYGLYMMDNQWHRQWRGDIDRHIAEGQLFLDECKNRAAPPWYQDTPGAFAYAIMFYNGSLAWGLRVEAKRDELVRWLSWRALRELEVAWR